jgi:hypothetical protein
MLKIRWHAFLFIILFVPGIVAAEERGEQFRNVSLYHYSKTAVGLAAHREVMAMTWTPAGPQRSNLSPPTLVMRHTVLKRLDHFRPEGDPREITRSDRYQENLERAFRHAVKHAGIDFYGGVVEIDRVFIGNVSGDVEDDAAAMSLQFMALFRGKEIPDFSTVVGVLQDDGRLGPVSAVAAKVRAVVGFAWIILVPTGQLTELSIPLRNSLDARRIRVEEVDTLEQAYERLAQSPSRTLAAPANR